MADDIDKLGYLFLCGILCVLPGSTAHKNSNELSTNEFDFQTSTNMSWWEARKHCKREYNSDLYLPSRQPSPTSFLENGTLYWVGAYEISEWKWTDNSSPFVHKGYLIQNESRTHKTIPGNCVEQCYSHCPNYTYIGLSETRCYCLDDYQMSNSMSKEIEDQCPGNFREKCGNSEGMSVYKTDIAFYDSRGGQCVYATWNGSIFLEPGSCKKMIRSVCSDADKSGTESNGCKDSNEYDQCRSGICVTCKRATWLKASLNCHLMNVTNENKEMLFDFLSNIKCQKDYWINLRVLKMKMWINGSETNNRTHSIGRNRTCLALEYSDFNNWTRHWKPCSEVYRALCDNAQLAYSAHKGMNLGVYLGSGVGLILLIGLLTAVLVACKRKDQKCFQRQQRAIGNDDQIRDPGTQGDIIAPSDKSVNFVVQPLSAAQAQATPEELYTQVAKTQREGFDENVYDRAGESRNPVVVENFYSHVTVDVENDYDIAGRKPEMERRDSIYNHLDYKRVDQEEEEVTM